jgi:hypothetical protein
MPPRNVRSIRQLIYWEYAKLMAGSAVGDRKNYRYVMHCFKKLETGQLHPSAILRENQLLVTHDKCCLYCGKSSPDLQWEHIIPGCRYVLDTIDNMVLACRDCNLAKGARDLFEWYGKARRYEIPRIALGKYLKLIFEIHEARGTLDAVDLNADGELDVFDLGAVLMSGQLHAAALHAAR